MPCTFVETEMSPQKCRAFSEMAEMESGEDPRGGKLQLLWRKIATADAASVSRAPRAVLTRPGGYRGSSGRPGHPGNVADGCTMVRRGGAIPQVRRTVIWCGCPCFGAGRSAPAVPPRERPATTPRLGLAGHAAVAGWPLAPVGCVLFGVRGAKGSVGPLCVRYMRGRFQPQLGQATTLHCATTLRLSCRANALSVAILADRASNIAT
jgi:hypothetical protein